MIQPPFNNVVAIKRKKLLLILLPCTIFIMAVLRVLNEYLITVAAPAGIISFEFSPTIVNSLEIIDSWGQEGSKTAALSLGLGCFI